MISSLCLAAVLLAGPESAPSDAAAGIAVPSLFGLASRTLPAAGQEQDFIRKTWREQGPFSDPGYLFLGVLVRQTTLWGDWFDGGLEDDDYGDLFKPGTGIVGEVGGLLAYREDWRVGLYLSFGWDTYEGDSVPTSGGDLKADDMTILTGLLGFRGMIHFAEILFVEGHIAGGVAYYPAVDATQGGVSGELFAASPRPAAEAGARFGIELALIQIEIGVGYRLQSGPSRGEDATNEVDPGLMNAFFIELGGALRF
jgi:hypothetical protein